MRHKQNQPYFEVINLDSEIKQYNNICRNKCNRIRTYSEWEKHITEDCLSKFQTFEQLRNFKHYLLYKQKMIVEATGIGFTIFPTLFTAIFSYLLSAKILTFFSFVQETTQLNALFSALITFLLAIKYRNFILQQQLFYSDFISIINEFERKFF